MKGSCLCGGCVFQIPDSTGPINKCHCTKCRKVSGTGSNAVLWIEPDDLVWVSGQELAKIYTMQDGWQSAFCGECGSPLPRYIPDEEWIVPAGLLDTDLDVPIRAHIFLDDKPSWEVIGDSAPKFGTVPA